MTFRGVLVRGSPTWRAWRGRAAAGGEVFGVPFRFMPGDNYGTGDLTGDEVTRLRGSPDVKIETFGAAPPQDAGRSDAAVVAARRQAEPHTPGWRQRQRQRG